MQFWGLCSCCLSVVLSAASESVVRPAPVRRERAREGEIEYGVTLCSIRTPTLTEGWPVNDRSPPAAACAAVPCLCAEVPEETGQCWFGETALWSHCYSCLCLSTCAEEPGHQSLGEGGLRAAKGRHKIR